MKLSFYRPVVLLTFFVALTGMAGAQLLVHKTKNAPQDDPHQDGWLTEVASQGAERQLEVVAIYLRLPSKEAKSSLLELAAPTFSARPLRPLDLDIVFQDAELTVWREKASADALSEPVFRDRQGFVQALEQLRKPFKEGVEVQVKFKLFRVGLEGTRMSTEAYFEASGETATGFLQQNALWTASWQLDSVDALARLIEVKAADFQEVASLKSKAAGRLLSDQTFSVIGSSEAFRRQLSYGVEHWVSRIQGVLGTDYFGHHGLAIGDANGDGLDDIYICQPGGLPNRLFLQNEDGSARDVSSSSGVDWLDRTRSALFLDLDNDGDQDLVAATESRLLLLENNGKAHFTLRMSVPEISNAYSLSAADFDRNGTLDLYACHYFPSESTNERHFPAPVPYYDAANGGANVLLSNDGRWGFTNVTAKTGLDENNRRWSFASAWEDYDNDGDMDLYVANDFGRNNLYRNENGHFVDVAAQTGLEDGAFGMSASWADFNRDGWMDLYVGNMFSAAGNRITFQPQFKPDAPAETRKRVQRLARGNSLYQNSADGTFQEVSGQAGVSMGRWSWGSHFVDLNNDGWEDVVVSNGYISSDDPKDL